MEAVVEQETAAKNGKKDLTVFDWLKVPIFVADKDRKVAYGNQAFADLLGMEREQFEGASVLSLIKSETSGMEKALLTGDTTPVETWATIRDKKYFLEYRPTPTRDSKGNVTGVVETIVDRTGQKLALQAVHELAVKAKAGELTARADVKAEGDYQLLVESINQMLDALINPLSVAANYVDRISKGDIPEKITEEYNGDFNNIKNNLNNCIGEIGVLVDEVGVVIGLAREGNLAKRANPDRTKGVYRKILRGINDALDLLINPLNIAASYVDKISKGDIPEKITEEYNGDFNNIKNNLNTCIEAINSLIADAKMLHTAAVEGKLAIRVDTALHQGDFRKIVQGVNETLDAVLLPINEASECLKEMAKGDLDVEMKGDYRGDHAIIKDNLNATLASLNDILNQVAVAVDQVTTGARQVSDSSQSLSQAATESASSLEEITASMHQLTSQTTHNAENATTANQLSTQARASAEKGDQEMSNMLKAMQEINDSATNISKIIKAIDEIAFQTNLLALNAAVEAARAGKHGKGFTVVAEEVRNLAQRSAAAAKETAEMIEGSIKKTEVGTRIAQDTSKALEEIVLDVAKVTDLIGEIAAASKEQAQGIGQINLGISQVDQVTQQVTASAEESASASEELSSQSLQLKQMLTKFRLKKQRLEMAAGFPLEITPEMMQMLKMMMQSQRTDGVKEPGMQTRPSGSRSPRKTGAAIRPADIINLDSNDFGNF